MAALLLLSALAAAPCGADETRDSPPPPLGWAHLWYSTGVANLSGGAEEFGLGSERYAGVALYVRAGDRWYLGGEYSRIAKDQTVASDGEELKDVSLDSVELNTKVGWDLGGGFAAAAGVGILNLFIDGTTVSPGGFEDPLSDFGFGVVVFGELDWRWRHLVAGVSLKYHYAADIIAVDYSGFRLGAQIGVVF